MNRLLFLVIGTFVTLACSHSTPNVQAAPATKAPAAAKKDPNEREPFWSDTIRQFSTLSRGWNRIPGRLGTGCAFDTLYAFKVRPGLTDKVMVLLNGGGMCWRSGQCDPKKGAFTKTSDDPSSDMAIAQGLLDVKNAQNPVRDWTLVYVPYCTGDAHLGSAEVEYQQPGSKDPSKTFKVRHGGAANLEAVLDWVYVNIKRPTNVLVVGTDAGAVASPVVAARLARHFPRAHVVQLGEGAGAYRGDSLSAMLGIWGALDYLRREDPNYRSLDSASFNFQSLYTAGARAQSRVKFAQLNAIEDPVQLAFLPQLGVKTTTLAKPLGQSLSELKTQVPGFRSFTAPGKVHSFLRSNAMYSLKVDGTALVDWVTQLVNDEPVADIGERLHTVAPVAPKPAPKKKGK